MRTRREFLTAAVALPVSAALFQSLPDAAPEAVITEVNAAESRITYEAVEIVLQEHPSPVATLVRQRSVLGFRDYSRRWSIRGMRNGRMEEIGPGTKWRCRWEGGWVQGEVQRDGTCSVSYPHGHGITLSSLHAAMPA